MRRADRAKAEKGRGAVTNPAGRFEGTRLEAADDGWGSLDELPRRAETVLAADVPRHAITRNQSPDVPFDQSVNPYQGCEHGCIYCFARPSHSYWNLGPGLDFETRIFHKPGLARLLDRELAHPGTSASRSISAPIPTRTSPRSASTARRVNCSRCCSASPPGHHRDQGRAGAA